MIRRAAELYRHGGLNELSRGVRHFVHYRSPWYRDSYHAARVDNEERWSLIEPHIKNAYFAVDIGCADGYFTERLGESGFHVTAIDNNSERLQLARERLEDWMNVSLINLRVTPENVDELPTADVGLLLTVQHHWAREFGHVAATRMLREFAATVDVLCYEPPGDRFLIESEPLETDDAINRYLRYLHRTIPDTEILDVGLFEYKSRVSGTRSDPLFVLDVSEFGGGRGD